MSTGVEIQLPMSHNTLIYTNMPDLLVTTLGKFRYHLASILAFQILNQKRLIVCLPIAQLLCLVTELCLAVHHQAQARSACFCGKG